MKISIFCHDHSVLNLVALAKQYFYCHDNCVGKVWKSKTRVTSYEFNPRVTSSNPQVRRLKARPARLKAQVGRLKALVRRLKARVEAIKPRVI